MAGIKQRREDQRTDSSVDDLNALAQLHVAQHSNGAEVYVISEATVYTLVKGIGTPPNGTTIIAPIPGAPSAGGKADRWFADAGGPVDIAAFCEQADWYIDPLNGNDENDGLTAATALKTHTEVRRRVDRCIIEQKTTIHILNDIDITDPVLVDFILGPSGLLIYSGEKPTTILHTGNFTTVTPTNQAANFQLEVSDGTSWAGLLNTLTDFRRIRIITSTDATHVGGVSYPTRETAPTVARTNDFKEPYSTLPTSFVPFFTPLVGDQYVVETNLTSIASLTVDVLDSSIAQTEPNGRVLFYNLTLSHDDNVFHPVSMVASGFDGGANPSSPVQFSGCNTARAAPVNGTLVTFDACKVGESPDETIQYLLGAVDINACLVVGQLAFKGIYNSNIRGRTLLDSFGVTISGLVVDRGVCTLNQVAIFAENAFGGFGIIVRGGATARAFAATDPPETVYGSGNALGVGVASGGTFIWENAKPTITGTIEVRVGGTDVPLWTTFGDNFTNLANLATVSNNIV